MIRFQITLIIHQLQNASWSVFLLRTCVATEKYFLKQFFRAKACVA